MFAFGVYDSGLAGESALVRWTGSAQLLDAVSGGNPVADGGAIARWLSEDGSNALDQATPAQRPASAASAFPGRPGILFAADDNLSGFLPSTQGGFLLILGSHSGTRTLLSRDTTQTTTAPAYSIAVEDYF